MKKRMIFALVLTIALGVGGYCFIKSYNDHKECRTVEIISHDKDGNQIVTQKHICKEEYSF